MTDLCMCVGVCMCYEEVNCMDMQTRTWLLVITDGWERAKFKTFCWSLVEGVSNVNSVTVYSLTLFQTCVKLFFCEKQKVFWRIWSYASQYNKSEWGLRLSSSKMTKEKNINVSYKWFIWLMCYILGFLKPYNRFVWRTNWNLKYSIKWLSLAG